MPRQKAPSLPQGRWRRKRKAGRRTKPRPHKRKRMRGGISLSRKGKGEGFGPSLDPQGVPRRGFGLGWALLESGKAFGRRRDPKRGFERLRLREIPREAGGFDPASFERATGEASASMRALERARLRPGPIRKGRDGQDFGPVQATRRGSVRDFRVSPETHRDPNGASRPRSGIRGKAKRASCPPRDPKPPSERWPRHPATAVKAGTSGGRWRHRPSL